MWKYNLNSNTLRLLNVMAEGKRIMLEALAGLYENLKFRNSLKVAT